MSRRPPAAPDDLAIERARAELRSAVAMLAPDRRAQLGQTLERAAWREEREDMANKPGRKKGAPPPALAIRFPAELLAAVDKATEQIAKERPDMVVTRSDAIRVLVAEALIARKVPIR